MVGVWEEIKCPDFAEVIATLSQERRVSAKCDRIACDVDDGSRSETSQRAQNGLLRTSPRRVQDNDSHWSVLLVLPQEPPNIVKDRASMSKVSEVMRQEL